MTQDILIFFGISFVILAVVFVICFLVVRAILKFIISFFKKKPQPHTMEGVLADKGEDLGVYVEALEKSKEERAKIQGQKQPAPTLKYAQPIKKSQEEVQINKEQEWAKKSQKDIEAGLSKLKEPGASAEEESFLGKQSKTGDVEESFLEIKIPVAKRQSAAGGIGAPVQKGEQGLKDQFGEIKEEDKIAVPGRTSTIQKNRMEGSKSSDIKIRKGALPKDLEKLAKIQAQQEGQRTVKKEEGPFFEKQGPIDLKKESKASEQKDLSIFGGRQEISRSELRQKLRDPKLDRIEKSVGLDMTPVQRAKLEKELFPGSYGLNISKSDIKTQTHKLSQKMLSEKNPQAKATLRKQINFIKKIGGIK